ncbi:hypothetical protein N7448_004147 [Penicillium atrosanguineum]|uniref:Uncharacterized protein n=1 Tax=Penicillium atrosanguineum TaxID=1132637 RepID=A0A9W9U5G5_9EURO|nr:uncharacterized protein N7443_003112 [Penicillium atrosanguineum]KAJ5117205.1 hypothetical protein N7526_011314 [Penicillium atrosanguineum]KAJ5140739.1 hypothetical protein N7448_004147 [Penicillium atrosanguineum]KAJ5310651.1 hypothetical protein N7443_003112 [Penicillium atrosanguineum]KAJ5316174.1 hypothetical protein N7476_006481 [Penicillium atrosanguineum]
MAPSLPPQYEIRVLGPEHEEWARAICLHTNMFHSPLWPVVYPENITQRLYKSFQAAHYLIKHQIDSGYSLGIFNKNYQFKRPESVATGGKLYWNFVDENATESELEEQMDFPLVSIAMAYDGINELDMNQIMPLVETLPLFATIVKVVEDRDTRDPASWKPTGPRQVLMRNATNTMKAHSGHGLMRLLAEEMMRQSAAAGFRGIQIESANNAVLKVWSNPPEPFKGTITCQFHTMTYEEKAESGETLYPFRPADLPIARIYVDLC